MSAAGQTPSSGPVGTRVRITGRITDDLATWQTYFRDPGYFDLLRNATVGVPAGCELLVHAEQESIRMDAAGQVSGSFVVGSTGGCFQRGRSYAPGAGQYDLAIGCHACGVATFRITGLPSTGRPVAPVAAAGLAAVAAGTALLWLGSRLSATSPPAPTTRTPPRPGRARRG
jgi:hypothetical protein